MSRHGADARGSRARSIRWGLCGTVVRLRGEDDIVVLADCATQPVVWRRGEISKDLAASVDVEASRVIAKDAARHPLRRSPLRGEWGWDDRGLLSRSGRS